MSTVGEQTTAASAPRALVVVEGPDGCGKTTISSLLCDELQLKTQVPWAQVTDPSDGPAGHLIRRWLASGTPYELEALGYLFFADHIHQLHRWSQPCVVADRYLLSTWVYQSGTMPDDVLLAALGDERLRVPDVVVYLDADRDMCLARLAERQKLDYFDAKERFIRHYERYQLAWHGRLGGKNFVDLWAVASHRVRNAVFGMQRISVVVGAREPSAVVDDIVGQLAVLDPSLDLPGF